MKAKQEFEKCELKQAVDWLFNGRMFAAPKQHGNTDWSFSTLGVHVSFCIDPLLAANVNRRFCGLSVKLRRLRPIG